MEKEGQVLPPLELLGPINKTKYLHPALVPELEALLESIREAKPNLILGLGSEVCAWLTGEQSIEAARGFLCECKHIPGQKVLCTYHPSSILAQWSNRPILVADLMKVKREMEFPEIKTKERKILLPESFQEVRAFIQSAPEDCAWSIDIETYPNLRLIRSVGLAFNTSLAMTIPFTYLEKENGSYWDSPLDELQIWRLLKKVLSTRNAKIFQNGLYDIQWLYEEARLSTFGFNRDTLINHHVLFPEMKKSLAFQVSLYCDEKIWKGMVDHKAGEGKQDG